MNVVADVVVTSPASGPVRVTARGAIGPSAGLWLEGRLGLIVEGSPGPAIHMIVDLTAVTGCDMGVLAVLHALHLRMVAAHGRLVVHGLDPAALTGFAGATVIELLAAYHASRVLAQPLWPREDGWRKAASRFTDSERQLIGFGAELAALGHTAGAAATDRLTAWCGRVFGMQTAVVLLTGDPASRGMAVVAASGERARLAAVVGLGAGEGPVAECLLREEPVGSADLEHDTTRWPLYVHEAQRYRVRAVRALPLRIPRPAPPGRSATVGVLILMSHRPGPMAPADLQVALALADLVGIALAGDAGWARGVPARDARESPGQSSGRDTMVVDRAVGVVAERERLTPEEARARLIEHARDRALSLTEYARSIADAPAGPEFPAPGVRTSPQLGIPVTS